MYSVRVSGIVHSVDPILSPEGYARAVFNEPSNVSVEADGKKLYFTLYRGIDVNGGDRIEDILAGILNGDDRNVHWTLDFNTK